MLPSARRAELSRQYFDNSYLSRKAFEAGGAGAPPPQLGVAPAPSGARSSHNPHHQLSHYGGGGGGGRDEGMHNGSIRSKTTAGLTTFEDDLDDSFDGSGVHSRTGHSVSSRSRGRLPQKGNSTFKLSPSYGSEFSDDNESLASVVSGNSFASEQYGVDSAAGQIWRSLCSLDDLLIEVKANICQCRRLGARLAALKKPMVAVHRGRQTADRAVLSTIKDLVMEAQLFMERFLDAEWWRKEAGHKEDSEMFRELTFRLGFLMQAPPGFQEQSQEEDRADRLADYGDLEAHLEEKLRDTRDERMGREIRDALRRVRMRMMLEETGAGSEIGFERLKFADERSLGNGGFGTVMVATLDGVSVAVKRLNNQNVKADLLEEMKRDVQEFHAMQYDFLVRTLGACTVHPNICIVQERAVTSLFDLLHGEQRVTPFLGSAEKAAMLYDVARGLQFLHIKGVVHGNLKSTNVLVFENNRLKLSDFGMIKLRELMDMVPAAAWTAPEVLDDEQPTTLSDVYSFGVLVHEVLTKRVPFAGKSVTKVITAVVAKGHRPGYLEHEEASYPPGLTKLLDVCWTQDPAARPKNLNGIVADVGHVVFALGGDPRSTDGNYHQPAGESASNTPTGSNATPSGVGLRVSRMTEQERRIHDLEQELLALKMLKGGAVGGGDGDGGRGPGSYLHESSSVASASVHLYESGGDSGVPAERKALRALYSATQGPGWFERGGWETNDPDLSRWYGVVCGEGGHVTALQLQSNNLTGQIPPELSGLKRLRVLVMADNLLEGPIPSEFGTLERLTELDLSMNDLTGAIPASLAEAVSLERMCLQCNGLVGNVPRTFQKLNNLKVFIVDWSSLSDTYPFRAFRKASPPPTEAEIERARSETRKAALERAKIPRAAAAPANSVLARQQIPHGYPSSIRPGPRGGQRTPVDVGDGRRGGRFKVAMKGAGATGQQQQWPADYKERGVVSRTNSGQWSNKSDQVSATRGTALNAASANVSPAPTAPYRGQDGMYSKAKEAETNAAPPPPRKWKNALSSAGKALKGVVGIEMHPGYVDPSKSLPSKGGK